MIFPTQTIRTITLLLLPITDVVVAQSSCVTMKRFAQPDCTGNVVEELSFSHTEPGKCVEVTAANPYSTTPDGLSFQNQHCDPATNSFKQDVFQGDCTELVTSQKFTQETCISGFKLVSCDVGGPCQDGDDAGACVNMDVFADRTGCTGEPMNRLTFSTASEPGSACISSTDINTVQFWIKDQACPSTTKFTQKVFISEDMCSSDEKKIDQRFTTTTCEAGIKLVSCTTGECGDDEEGNNTSAASTLGTTLAFGKLVAARAAVAALAFWMMI